MSTVICWWLTADISTAESLNVSGSLRRRMIIVSIVWGTIKLWKKFCDNFVKTRLVKALEIEYD